MRRARLHLCSLTYHWRTNLAVVLGAAVATSALTGALLVGDSMRASLVEIALGRLGKVDHALIAPRFFTADLAGRVSADPAWAQRFAPAVPIILMQGAARHAETRALAGSVNIIGVDDRYWHLAADVGDAPGAPSVPRGEVRLGQHDPGTGGLEVDDAANTALQTASADSSDGGLTINDALAAELGAKVGDDLVLRLRRPSAISTESLLGRRDEAAASVRLPIVRIVPARGLGAFSIESRQTVPKNVFVSLDTLQRALKQDGSVNALLIGAKRKGSVEQQREAASALQQTINDQLTSADLGLRFRIAHDYGYVALESDALLIPSPVEKAAMAAAEEVGAMPSPILTHLANSIALSGSQSRSIPYSTIAALAVRSPTAERLRTAVSEGTMLSAPGEILLNRWAADDLQAKPGDKIEVTYYVSGPLGRLDTRKHAFTLSGVLAMEGPAMDQGFIPEYPGVTDTQNLADWDPPFPVDLKKVRDQDEQYWDEYRTAPKAFITLEDGQELWAGEGERLGRLTSIRISPPDARPIPSTASDEGVSAAGHNESGMQAGTDGGALKEMARRFEAAVLEKLAPAELGFAVQSVRANALAASRGSTDFGGLFIGFSLFLIAAAAMLVGLLFRLGVERRAAELGALLAVGFAPRSLTWNLVLEGVILSSIGGLFGLAAASGYAWLMLAGLRTWWSSAVNSPFLELHVLPQSYAIGFLASVLIAAASAGWAVRGLARRSVRSLLSGSVSATAKRAPRLMGLDTVTAILCLLTAVLLTVAAALTELLSPVLAFFLAGGLVLIGAMALFGRWLRQPSKRVLHVPGPGAVARLAARNAPRYRGRGMLTASLIACATFVIVALEAFRLPTTADINDKESGTGGFALFAESAVPLPYDPNTSEGREALGIDVPTPDLEVFSFRLRPGDEASCLNLYVPVQPRVIGAPDSFVERGGFTFAGAMEQKPAGANPWHLLKEDLGPHVVPAIADEAAVLWQMHSGLGKEFIITSQAGQEVRLRFVALLKGSALQDEIIISEKAFERLFPGMEGHAFFLIETTPEQASAVESDLEYELDRFGFDVGSTAKRLEAYNSVQNTYLSTFQTLGGLGLVLGTFGLAAVLLRNVWERRRELALMRATGFSRAAIGSTVILENAFLVAVGLVSGVAAALVAVAPRLLNQPESLPLKSLALLLGLVLAAGFVAGLLGLLSTFRINLVASLRAE